MEVIKKERQIKEVEVTVESYTLCDKCGEKIETGKYESFECEFTHKTGSCYPDGCNIEIQEMQLCQKCAVECVELLQKNGYRINESDESY